MKTPFQVLIPLVAREPQDFEVTLRFIGIWQDSKWRAGEFAPREILITLAYRSGRPRPQLPSSTTAEQWQVMVCQGEVDYEYLGVIDQALMSLAGFMQAELRLEEPATLRIGDEERKYHRLTEAVPA